jgi:hypothetical protein
MYAEFAKKNNTDFVVCTKPVHSTQSLTGEIVNANTTLGYAYLKFAKNQQMIFFEPALGSSGQLAADPNHKWTEADTNLTKPRSTPGAADMAIEGIGFEVRDIKPEFAASTGYFPAAQTVDKAVDTALRGFTPIYDPGNLVLPVELSSPVMLEQVPMSALAPHLTMQFEWDQATRTEKIGTANQLTTGGGSSLLHANGLPSPQNRFEIPEGYIWSRDGEADCEFVCRMTLADDVIIPIHLNVDPEGVPSTFSAPTNIHIEFVMRAFGLQLRMPGKN